MNTLDKAIKILDTVDKKTVLNAVSGIKEILRVLTTKIGSTNNVEELNKIYNKLMEINEILRTMR